MPAKAPGKPQAGTAWSPPLVGDFHALDKFGVLQFADEQGKVPPPPVAMPMPPAHPIPGARDAIDPKKNPMVSPALLKRLEEEKEKKAAMAAKKPGEAPKK